MGGVAVREEALGLGIGAELEVVHETDTGAVQLVEDKAGQVEMLALAGGLADAVGGVPVLAQHVGGKFRTDFVIRK